MIVTLAELESLSKRALAGRGAPPGLDEDAAFATAWLESRGLPALAALVALLDRQLIELRPLIGDGSQFDAAGQSAVLLCGTVIDQVVVGGGDGHLVVANLSDPLFLLPLADKRRRSGWSFVLNWEDSRGATIDSETGVMLSDPNTALPALSAVDVTIRCRLGSFAAGSGTRELGEYRRSVLARGLSVDDALWRRLSNHGASRPGSGQCGIAATRCRGADQRQRVTAHPSEDK